MKKTKEFLSELQGLCFKHGISFTACREIGGASGGNVGEELIELLEATPEGCLIEVTNPKAIGRDRNKRVKLGVGKFQDRNG